VCSVAVKVFDIHGYSQFSCPPTSLAKVTTAVSAPGLCRQVVGSELIYVPVDPAEPPDEHTSTKVTHLVEVLENLEDTRRVWTSLDAVREN
jgi:translational activator of cytochrome c oxidase 1